MCCIKPQYQHALLDRLQHLAFVWLAELAPRPGSGAFFGFAAGRSAFKYDIVSSWHLPVDVQVVPVVAWFDSSIRFRPLAGFLG